MDVHRRIERLVMGEGYDGSGAQRKGPGGPVSQCEREVYADPYMRRKFNLQ